MMTLEEMKQRKNELGLTNERIAELSGIPLSTVQKIFAGVTERPRYRTMEAIGLALDPRSVWEPSWSDVDGDWSDEVQETVAVYGDAAGRERRQGEYTAEDYRALPDDVRAELIDGVIYIMEAPTLTHQEIAGAIYIELKQYIKKNKGLCRAFMAPADVHITKDRKNVFQPDVFVVCRRDKLIRNGMKGAPDMVVEVLSPATRRKDMITKLNTYVKAGVRECWMIDPVEKRILVYLPEDDDLEMKIYGFGDEIPVAIFDGNCVIDMKAICEEIDGLSELETWIEDDEE